MLTIAEQAELRRPFMNMAFLAIGARGAPRPVEKVAAIYRGAFFALPSPDTVHATYDEHAARLKRDGFRLSSDVDMYDLYRHEDGRTAKLQWTGNVIGRDLSALSTDDAPAGDLLFTVVQFPAPPRDAAFRADPFLARAMAKMIELDRQPLPGGHGAIAELDKQRAAFNRKVALARVPHIVCKSSDGRAWQVGTIRPNVSAVVWELRRRKFRTARDAMRSVPISADAWTRRQGRGSASYLSGGRV